jgi:hypothetical protein
MGKRLALLLMVWVLTLAVGTLALATSSAPQATKTEKVPKEKCLGCHGSYDKLREKTKDYKAASGETVTPHQYVPHADAQDIPECTECHTPHTIPLTDKSKVVKPKDLDFCFQSGCHHMRNLQNCHTCHG